MSDDNCEYERVKVDDLPFYSSPKECSYALQDREPGVLQEKVKVVRTGMVEMFTLAEQNIYAGAALFSSAYAPITKEENLDARRGVTGAGCWPSHREISEEGGVPYDWCCGWGSYQLS